ncbi:MAG: hypothetical protein U1A22_04750 [Xanthomonadaceae bacterium]|nr:hypothetical protein [Xanthomonadaceae bacterium]
MTQASTSTQRRAEGQAHDSTDWRAGLWAGLIAGLVFLMLEMLLVWMVQGQSPWGPPYMMAAMVFGSEILPVMGSWAPFDPMVAMTAMMIHLPMSAAIGLLGAALMQRFEVAGVLIIGAALGLALYGVNFYLIAPIAFPWFEMGRNWIGAISHLMFGVALGLAYLALRRSRSDLSC